MFIDEETAQERIKNSHNILTRISRIESPKPSEEVNDSERPVDSDVVDANIKKLLMDTGTVKRVRALTTPQQADCAIVGELVGRQQSAALFHRSNGRVDSIRQGLVGHSSPKLKPSLIQSIEDEKEKIRSLASDRLTAALGLITDDKLKGVHKPKELAIIAHQMASIVEKTLPKEMRAADQVQFHIYRPEIKQENNYEVIEVE